MMGTTRYLFDQNIKTQAFRDVDVSISIMLSRILAMTQLSIVVTSLRKVLSVAICYFGFIILAIVLVSFLFIILKLVLVFSWVIICQSMIWIISSKLALYFKRTCIFILNMVISKIESPRTNLAGTISVWSCKCLADTWCQFMAIVSLVIYITR